MNAFAWFIPRPNLLPVLPGAEAAGTAVRVEVGYCARYPRNGLNHPWLHAVVITNSHLIGVVSKRCEPFREASSPRLRDTDCRPWQSSNMANRQASRQGLRDDGIVYQYLDAGGLVIHAGEARRLRKAALLHYIFAEPSGRGAGAIAATDHWQHRAEIADFAARVSGDDVGCSACSYREWPETCEGAARVHALNVANTFAP